ncbi:MAG: NifU N-terminal domain-containing protein [Holophagaceae bacterium]|nr:NifU N-terminal domain-containing protein [Holophagaceae bacterium]
MPKIAEIEYASDPNTVKFVLKEPVASGFPRNYANAEIAQTDPLAKALFDAGRVESVVMVDKWITITKGPGVAWNELLPKLAPPIRQAPAVAGIGTQGEAPGMTINQGVKDDPLLQKVFAALKEHIYPFMAADGGGLEVVGRSEKQVLIRYMGACQNCPAGMTGTLMAIEGVLRAEVDPHISVVTV